MPVANVSAAAQRNHHNARHVILSMASDRTFGSSAANAGVWTKLKK